MHESSLQHPPQRIGVEPRSPPTASHLLDGMSPNGDEDEDELTSMTSVSRLLPEVRPPKIKNRLSENRKYYDL